MNARMRGVFPDREFIMRSQGQVRFITISSKLQRGAAVAVVAALLAWGLSMAGMGWSQYQAQADRNSLIEREAQVASAQTRVSKYRDNINEVAGDLERRQEFLEGMVPLLPEDARAEDTRDGETVGDPSQVTAETIDKVSFVIPEAAALARIEARQLAFAERLTRYADRRARRAETAIRRLGLDPRAMMISADKSAMGGPFEKLATQRDGRIDARFERLGVSLTRMAALERGLKGIPQFAPAKGGSMSSEFGYRRDPFNGSSAMHSGVDFKAPRGSPIRAAANGRVSFAGVKGGYGRTIEIDHGNGLMTRYAHMAFARVTVGQRVAAGSVIGGIGSTGRSTGPHLHFEVRVNNRAVNPRIFLEVAPDVLKEARRQPQRQSASKLASAE